MKVTLLLQILTEIGLNKKQIPYWKTMQLTVWCIPHCQHWTVTRTPAIHINSALYLYGRGYLEDFYGHQHWVWQ